MSNNQIIPECWADTLLIEILGFENVNHQGGIGKVLKIFDKNFKNRSAVGIIDNDKVKPKDLDMYVQADLQEKIQKLTKPGSRHIMLVICPAFEDWVFGNAEAVKVDPSKYGFRTRNYFRDICKSENASENQQLKQFLNTLKQKRAPGFTQLKTWICEGAGIDEGDI